MKASIAISALFKQKTINNLSYYLVHNKEDNVVIEPSIISRAEEQILSFAQERLWFIERYEEGSNAYNVPMIYKLSKDINLNILEKSIRSIVKRHEVLRTVIRQDEEGTGYQLLLDDEEAPLSIRRIELNSQRVLDEELCKEMNHIYDLGEEYPIRVAIYEIIEDSDGCSNSIARELSGEQNQINKSGVERDYYISIIIHHIAFDGWSNNIFFEELERYYKYYLDLSLGLASNLELPRLSVQYKDFALWQRYYLQGERLEAQLNYWKSKLSGYEGLNLITDKTRPMQIDYQGSDLYFEIEEKVSVQLRDLAKEFGVSLYSLLLAGYYLMLRVYSNQDDIVVGTPIANRHYNQIENLIGFFVNSLALRCELDKELTIKEFIKQVGLEVVEAQLHQDLPFEKLVEELNVSKDTSRHPIFQVMFGVQDFVEGVGYFGGEEKLRILEPYYGEDLYKVAKFDISTFVDNSNDKLVGSFNYAVSLYNEGTISSFIKTYIQILSQFAALVEDKEKKASKKIRDLNYLTEFDYDKIVREWNETDRDYPRDKTIHGLFEEQVERTPDNIAIVYEDKRLTYRELNERANRLANYLRKNYKIEPDDLIALCLDRSEDMLIAILAVLKAGGAYVPMDPSYPDERIGYILKDTGVSVLISNEIYRDKLESIISSIAGSKASFSSQLVLGAKVERELGEDVWLEEDAELGLNSNKAASSVLKVKARRVEIIGIDCIRVQGELLKEPVTIPETKVTSQNLSYVIYTSGTTGNPKGVMIEHKGCIVRILYMIKENKLVNTDLLMFKTNFVFDVAFSDIFCSLLSGVTLYMTKKSFDINEIKKKLENYQISICHFVQSQY